ncbi:MAG: aldehyde ferredoxin oxidoreductase family protein [Bacteroidetes bacterium]|jgi:aldehyde:ferredoxin oxidoreductase|nr:aldehyde ferredoxin oxidoreductase family protein [Bacteroidota bacterium]MBT6685049.1 aldehyde ferredoxin oxidoreductase family protein [Bacteroidota bacterium]MBT7143188.1 aldehyde ferredoxin oxidoreductase family protein [Bacteroidota bacterium]MBT7491010.1 aldehyde ferredoxin oxidoreductase family protein [Bacteroidota bacterium]
MKGVFNKIYSVNLSKKTAELIQIADDIYHKYLGGRGLGVKIFTDKVNPKIDPLSADNAIVLTTGPITGTSVSTSGRMSLVTKSPLTGGIFYSNTGGNFGFNMKRCGIDGVLIVGKSEKPSYLLLDGDNKLEIKDATDLWGLDAEQTHEKLLELEGKKARTLEIGPAGENLVRISSIMNDADHAFGRGGVGAVWGSKNLKAIVVKNGKLKTTVHNPKLLKNYSKSALDKIKALPVTRSAFPLFGTAGVLHVTNSLSMLPIRNFKYGQHEEAPKLGGEAIRKEILDKTSACYACTIRCRRSTKTGKMKGKGPEYESVWALGANCEIFDLKKVTEANYYCNKLGIDTISMGVTISCAMELQEKGLFPYENVKFGNDEIITDLVKKTALREGIGNDLAEGSKRLAEKYGDAEVAIHVKGLELPAYDPRGAMGHALGYVTSNRGGCHLTGYLAAMELFSAPKRIPRFTISGKADLLVLKQNQSAIEDSLVNCKFSGYALGFDFHSRFASVITGYDYNTTELLRIGERIYNLERIFNIDAGIEKEQDKLPERFIKEPFKEGLSKDRVVPVAKMLKEYYAVRNWDENGIPTIEKRKELEII